MKDIKKLLRNVSYNALLGEPSGDITELVFDTRKVEKDCLFICLKGENFDSHESLKEIILGGAKVVLVEKNGNFSIDKELFNEYGVLVLEVPDTREALAILSANFFDNPADNEIKVIGITGTKGKTTTTYMIRSILEAAGQRTGLIGTIEAIIGDEHIPANNTTPESYIVQKYFRKMADIGLKYCVMEVSSQGLMMHRVDGFTFEIGIFTNLSPDHIGPNEHKSFDEYKECKALLFKKCKKGIFNIDDEHYGDMAKDATCEKVTYGIKENADFLAKDISLIKKEGAIGVSYSLLEKDKEIFLEIPLPGRFSVYNSLSAVAVCRSINVPYDIIKDSLKKAKTKGRIELIDVSESFTLMIDYAHNAMALESLLTTLREYEPKRLVTLFGCGGNRAKSRRYEMGEVSGRLSDLTVITSDNPRFEEPEDIIKDIITGIEKTDGKYVSITDRKEAIRYVIKNALPGDVIVLAGKGHEDYQEIKGKKYKMDERDLIKEVMDS